MLVARLALTLALTAASGPALAQMNAPGMGGPPPQARDACRDKGVGDACSFQAPHGAVEGTCAATPTGSRACRPAGAPSGPIQGGPMQNGQRQGNQMQGGPMQGGPMQGGQGGGPRSRGYTPAAPWSGAVRSTARLADTGQVTCFDADRAVDCGRVSGFPGQDGQIRGREGVWRDNGDGTVLDAVTGLMWQKAHNADRLGYRDAERACAALTLGGRSDWRLPTIKELFSISWWQGATGQRPFVDSRYFDIDKPDASVLEGDRFASTHTVDMMGQTWSSTLYAGDHWDRPGVEAAFFFNFLDGRIKQAPTSGPTGMFWRCVAGPEWGANAFVDNGDGTVTDDLAGLMWQRSDDGRARDWGGALRACDALSLGGHDDWRLPNVRELQSIVDYARPQPAIDTRVFRQADPAAWFWSSTTHGERTSSAAYVCFGKCVSVNGVDTHGAGAQRSDPKAGDPSSWGPMGGQRDDVRIDNFVRCVRDAGGGR